MADTPQTDAALLALWEQWKRQLTRTLETSSHEISDLRHTELVATERDILTAQAEGLPGLAIQLGLVRVDKARALEMFNNGEGGFKDRDLYVSCANASNGIITAHPRGKGAQLRDIKDERGFAFGERNHADGH
jgi:hypothetical protein